jgi:diguanylate cyclase (GGDEF)-like protein/PAS domain S-box-containing protein
VKNDTIFLIIKSTKDIKLLKDMLGPKYQILESNEITDTIEVDLIITDHYSYLNNEKMISDIIKEQQPLLLPVLVVTKNKRLSFEQQFNNHLLDIIKIPVPRNIILKRVSRLLELRFYSKQAENKFDLIVENSPVGILVVESGKIKYANPYLIEIFGHKFEQIVESDQELSLLLLRTNKELKNYKFKFSSNDSEKWILINSKTMPYQNSDSWVYIIKEITAQKQREQEIEYMLYHDDLTDLYNRKYLNDNLLNNPGELSAVETGFLALDINNLKLINDNFSSDFGDEIIIGVSQIIKSLTSNKDFLFRVGGDEFLIILPNKNLIETEKMMEKIKIKSEKMFGDDLQLSIGSGAAVKKRNDEDMVKVIEKATQNMYINKLTEDHSIKSHIIKSMLKTLQVKSFETEDHASRMDNLAIKLGEKAGLNRKKLDELAMLAKLHDIGKVAIPESILKKPGRLNEEEFNLIKTHPEIGYRIVESIPNLIKVAEGILSHHERWDGNGYPQGLKENNIPLIARIITIIDSFDVMTNERAYKKAYSVEYAVEELKRCSGTQFDPTLADMFINEILSEELSLINSV